MLTGEMSAGWFTRCRKGVTGRRSHPQGPGVPAVSSPGVTLAGPATRAGFVLYLLTSVRSRAQSEATLLSGFSSPGMVAQPCFST